MRVSVLRLANGSCCTDRWLSPVVKYDRFLEGRALHMIMFRGAEKKKLVGSYSSSLQLARNSNHRSRTLNRKKDPLFDRMKKKAELHHRSEHC